MYWFEISFYLCAAECYDWCCWRGSLSFSAEIVREGNINYEKWNCGAFIHNFTESFFMCIIQIVPEKCRYEVLGTKVEIRLAKAEIITWASLEYGKGQAILPKPNVASGFSFFLLSFISEDTIVFIWSIQTATVKIFKNWSKCVVSHVIICSYAAVVSQRPVYPSSKPGKDWDKLEAEVKKQVPLSTPEAFTQNLTILFLCLLFLNVCRRRMRSSMEMQLWTSFSAIYTRVLMRTWGEPWTNPL